MCLFHIQGNVTRTGPWGWGYGILGAGLGLAGRVFAQSSRSPHDPKCKTAHLDAIQVRNSTGYPNKERELHLLGLSGDKREKLTLANLSKHLTEGKVEEAIFGADGNQHSSGDATSETGRCPHEEACASSVLSPSNTLLRRDRPHRDCMQWANRGFPEERVQREGRQYPRMFALSASGGLSASLSCTGWAVSPGPCQPFLHTSWLPFPRALDSMPGTFGFPGPP